MPGPKVVVVSIVPHLFPNSCVVVPGRRQPAVALVRSQLLKEIEPDVTPVLDLKPKVLFWENRLPPNSLVGPVSLRACENASERGFRVPQESWFQPLVVVEPQRAPRLQQVEPPIQTDEYRFSVIDDRPLDGVQDSDERS